MRLAKDPSGRADGRKQPAGLFWIRTGAPRQVPSHVARRDPGPRQWPEAHKLMFPGAPNGG